MTPNEHEATIGSKRSVAEKGRVGKKLTFAFFNLNVTIKFNKLTHISLCNSDKHFFYLHAVSRTYRGRILRHEYFSVLYNGNKTCYDIKFFRK